MIKIQLTFTLLRLFDGDIAGSFRIKICMSRKYIFDKILSVLIYVFAFMTIIDFSWPFHVKNLLIDHILNMELATLLKG